MNNTSRELQKREYGTLTGRQFLRDKTCVVVCSASACSARAQLLNHKRKQEEVYLHCSVRV